MLGLLINGHSPDDAAVWRRRGQLDLDGTGLGNLTVEFLQQRRVLREGEKRRRRLSIELKPKQGYSKHRTFGYQSKGPG